MDESIDAPNTQAENRVNLSADNPSPSIFASNLSVLHRLHISPDQFILPQREPMAALRVSTSVVVERGRFEPVERSSLHKAPASVSHGQSMQAEEDHRSVPQNHSCYAEDAATAITANMMRPKAIIQTQSGFALKSEPPGGAARLVGII